MLFVLLPSNWHKEVVHNLLTHVKSIRQNKEIHNKKGNKVFTIKQYRTPLSVY